MFGNEPLNPEGFNAIFTPSTPAPVAEEKPKAAASTASPKAAVKEEKSTVASTAASQIQTETISFDTDNFTRQTFIIRDEHLETLKDFVHQKRIEGQTAFTQKEALDEVLSFYFASHKIPSRPDYIKRQEIQIKERSKKNKSSI